MVFFPRNKFSFVCVSVSGLPVLFLSVHELIYGLIIEVSWYVLRGLVPLFEIYFKSLLIVFFFFLITLKIVLSSYPLKDLLVFPYFVLFCFVWREKSTQESMSVQVGEGQGEGGREPQAGSGLPAQSPTWDLIS